MILLHFPFTIMCFQNFRPQEFLLAKRDSISFSFSFFSKFFSLLGTPPLRPYANCAPPLTSMLRSPTTTHARRGHSTRRIQCGSPLVGAATTWIFPTTKGVVAGSFLPSRLLCPHSTSASLLFFVIFFILVRNCRWHNRLL